MKLAAPYARSNSGRRDIRIASVSPSTARVPTEMILQTNLLGDEKAISERIQAYENVGVTTLKVTPRGKTVSDRLDTLARLLELT